MGFAYPTPFFCSDCLFFLVGFFSPIIIPSPLLEALIRGSSRIRPRAPPALAPTGDSPFCNLYLPPPPVFCTPILREKILLLRVFPLLLATSLAPAGPRSILVCTASPNRQRKKSHLLVLSPCALVSLPPCGKRPFVQLAQAPPKTSFSV